MNMNMDHIVVCFMIFALLVCIYAVVIIAKEIKLEKAKHNAQNAEATEAYCVETQDICPETEKTLEKANESEVNVTDETKEDVAGVLAADSDKLPVDLRVEIVEIKEEPVAKSVVKTVKGTKESSRNKLPKILISNGSNRPVMIRNVSIGEQKHEVNEIKNKGQFEIDFCENNVKVVDIAN